MNAAAFSSSAQEKPKTKITPCPVAGCGCGKGQHSLREAGRCDALRTGKPYTKISKG